MLGLKRDSGDTEKVTVVVNQKPSVQVQADALNAQRVCFADPGPLKLNYTITTTGATGQSATVAVSSGTMLCESDKSTGNQSATILGLFKLWNGMVQACRMSLLATAWCILTHKAFELCSQPPAFAPACIRTCICTCVALPRPSPLLLCATVTGTQVIEVTCTRPDDPDGWSTTGSFDVEVTATAVAGTGADCQTVGSTRSTVAVDPVAKVVFSNIPSPEICSNAGQQQFKVDVSNTASGSQDAITVSVTAATGLGTCTPSPTNCEYSTSCKRGFAAHVCSRKPPGDVQRARCWQQSA